MRNTFTVVGEVVYIDLANGLVTLIDLEDLPIASGIAGRWYAHKGKNGYTYVRYDYKQEGKKRSIYLHRLLLGSPKGMRVDHINHDTLDNRRSTNLRSATPSENNQNRKGAQSNNLTSGIRGVSWHKASSKWQVKVEIEGKQVYLGVYSNLNEAEKVAIEARKRLLPYSTT